MEYLIKNRKLLFFIFLFSLLFIPMTAHAYVYKGFEYATEFTQYEFTGTVADGSLKGITFQLSSPIQKSSDFDILAIRFDKFNFYQDNYLVIDNPIWSQGTYDITCLQSTNEYCSKYRYSISGGQSLPQDLFGTITNGGFSFYAVAYSSQGWGEPCYFDKTLDGNILCPIKQNPNIDKVIFVVSQDGFPDFSYDIKIDRLKGLWNNESTEIVNGLLGVQLNIADTTTAIEQQTQQQAQQNAYVQSSNISQAQTNTSDNITVLNDQLTAELSQFSDLTQLVVAPITMFMELNNNVCAPLTLQIPFVNQTAVLPCIKPIMTQYFGGMYSVFTTVIGAILCYWTFVRTVALIKDLVDADNDKIEVVDL